MTGTLTQTNDQWVELIRNYHRVTMNWDDAIVLISYIKMLGTLQVKTSEKDGKVTIEKV